MFSCSYCSESFTFKMELKQHLNTQHSDNLKQHQLSKHSDHQLTKQSDEQLTKHSDHQLTKQSDHQLTKHIDIRPEQQKISKEVSSDVCSESFPSTSKLNEYSQREIIMEEEAKLVGEKSNKQLESCSICQKAFSTRSELNRHMLSHSERKLFTCVKCQKSYKILESFKRHELLQTCTNKLEQLKCNICFKSFLQKRILKKHMNTHSDEKKFKCTKCNESFKCSWNLKKHEIKHTGVHEHKCRRCDMTFTTSLGLRRHENKHSDIVYNCDYCDKRFLKYDNMIVHKRSVHEDSASKFMCAVCPREFKSKRSLLRHTDRVHSDDTNKCSLCFKVFSDLATLDEHKQLQCCDIAPFFCKICNLAFKVTADLRHHIRVGHKEIRQSSEKPFQCGKCNVCFRRAETLGKHYRTLHSSEHSDYLKCYECFKLFPNEPELKIHVRTHSVFKDQYPCFKCGRSFNRSSNLKLHYTVHTTTQLFSCDECKSKFKSRGSLKQHKLHVHLGIRSHHCFTCNMSFVTDRVLQKHFRRLKHKKIIEAVKTTEANVNVEPLATKEFEQCNVNSVLELCYSENDKLESCRSENNIKLDPDNSENDK